MQRINVYKQERRRLNNVEYFINCCFCVFSFEYRKKKNKREKTNIRKKKAEKTRKA